MTATDKAFELLDFIVGAENPPGLLQLVEMSALKKATVRRSLIALVQQGFVRQDSQRRYHPGLRPLDLATVALDSLALAFEARDVVDALCDQVSGTLTLAEYADGQLKVLLTLASSDPYRVAGRGLESTGFHATAAGKAILACLPRPDVRWALGPEPFPLYTPNTLMGFDALDSELKQIADQGYALNDEESRLGVRCVAVTIRNHLNRPAAVLSVSVATSQASIEDLHRAAHPLLLAAHAISDRIGGSSETRHISPAPNNSQASESGAKYSVTNDND